MTARNYRRGRVAAASLVAALALAGPMTPAARADCASAEVYITRAGSTTKQYVVGPKRCLVNTPFTEGVTVGDAHQQSGLPAGAPNGYGWTIWLPTP